MIKALAKRSDILKRKYAFFINRILTYLMFLLIPIYIESIAKMNLFTQSLILIIYMFFMGGQWYLLGKEVDHRFKIYYKANSSIERILYRLVLGTVLTIVLFNIFSLFPYSVSQVLFWIFYACVGLFYSWPTRGKIIEESMTGQFGEYKFLDSFERTVLVTATIMFFVSVPQIPLFQNIDALKIYLDAGENIHFFIWNFLNINYVPFASNAKLFNLAWNFHFYFLGLGTYLMAFYALLRFFFSRRLSILGVFAIISTWSFSLILADNIAQSFTTTFLLIWVWSNLWSIKSETYRSGLFTGLVLAFGVMINIQYIYLVPITLCFTYFNFLKQKTTWYKRQWLKYNTLGVVLSLIIIFTHFELGKVFQGIGFNGVVDFWAKYISRKAFFTLSIIGLLMIFLNKIKSLKIKMSFLNIDQSKLLELFSLVLVIVILGAIINPLYVQGFSILWFIGFLSLIPLEWIFQSIHRLRSKRNIIYVLYILVCLLDSHFEGRVRSLVKLLFSDDISKYINQL